MENRHNCQNQTAGRSSLPGLIPGKKRVPEELEDKTVELTPRKMPLVPERPGIVRGSARALCDKKES